MIHIIEKENKMEVYILQYFLRLKNIFFFFLAVFIYNYRFGLIFNVKQVNTNNL